MRDADLAPFDEFKETEVGPIPVEWEVVSLGEICKPRKEITQPQQVDRLRYVGLEHIDSGKPVLGRWGWSDEVRSSKNRFYAGDVLYGKLRPYLDKAVLTSWEGICSTDIIVFVAEPKKALAEFLANLLHTQLFVGHAISTTSGTNHPRTSWQALRSFPVPLPPLPEQRRIAHVLSTIQREITVQDALIAAAHKVKRSLMQRLFTYGSSAEPAPTKETEIGEIPEHWEVVQLGEMAKIERGKFAHRPRNDPRFYGGKTPFIQTGDVAQANGRITTYSQTLNELGLSVSRVFPKGTIVITIAANIGYTGILEFDSAFPDSLIGITPNNSFDVRFLEYYLQTQRAEMDRMAPRGTQKNINIQFLKPWPVSKPPLDEQQVIAQMLRASDGKITAGEQRKAALQALFKSMLHQLMTGRLRLTQDFETQRRKDAETQRGP